MRNVYYLAAAAAVRSTLLPGMGNDTGPGLLRRPHGDVVPRLPPLLLAVIPTHLITAKHALAAGRRFLSAQLLVQTVAALNYWRTPAFGFRRNFDITCTTVTSFWFARIAVTNGSARFLVPPLLCLLLSYALEMQVGCPAPTTRRINYVPCVYDYLVYVSGLPLVGEQCKCNARLDIAARGLPDGHERCALARTAMGCKCYFC